jgi:hypothetical protein
VNISKQTNQVGGKMTKEQDRDHRKYLDRYALLVGKLVINLQSLEFLLRAFLQAQPGAEPIGLPQGQNILSTPVGSIVNLCPTTNWDTLGELIKKYNAIAEAKSLPKLDPTLVDIRDALAHGRIATLEFGKPTRLIKYSKPLKPHKTTVQVTFNALLDEDWFSKQVADIGAAMAMVYGLAQSGGLTLKLYPQFQPGGEIQ